MKIDRQRVGTVEILTPDGPLVDEDAKAFQETLTRSLRTATPRIVVDMNEVAYCDSKALEGLLAAGDELNEHGTPLKLAGLTATCREILQLTGLAGEFQIFEDVHDAVRSFL